MQTKVMLRSSRNITTSQLPRLNHFGMVFLRFAWILTPSHIISTSGASPIERPSEPHALLTFLNPLSLSFLTNSFSYVVPLALLFIFLSYSCCSFCIVSLSAPSNLERQIFFCIFIASTNNFKVNARILLFYQLNSF